jgi:hypothetical protein
MNRRNFLKGAILLPSLASLWPVLARTPQPLAAPMAVELPDSGLVILERVSHFFGASVSTPTRVISTFVYYAGTLGRLDELHALALKSESVEGLHLRPDCEEIRDESGYGAGWITHDWGKLMVELRGCWIAQPGVVKRGETGLTSMDRQ